MALVPEPSPDALPPCPAGHAPAAFGSVRHSLSTPLHHGSTQDCPCAPSNFKRSRLAAGALQRVLPQPPQAGGWGETRAEQARDARAGCDLLLGISCLPFPTPTPVPGMYCLLCSRLLLLHIQIMRQRWVFQVHLVLHRGTLRPAGAREGHCGHGRCHLGKVGSDGTLGGRCRRPPPQAPQSCRPRVGRRRHRRLVGGFCRPGK